MNVRTGIKRILLIIRIVEICEINAISLISGSVKKTL